MKKYIHSITCTVFEQDPQAHQAIIEALNLFFPTTPITQQHATGIDNQQITIFRVTVTKPSLTHQFINKIKTTVTHSDWTTLNEQKLTRLDEHGNFYLRLDKQSVLGDAPILTDSGDCFHFRILVAAYPNNRENQIKSLNQIFETQ